MSSLVTHKLIHSSVCFGTYCALEKTPLTVISHVFQNMIFLLTPRPWTLHWYFPPCVDRQDVTFEPPCIPRIKHHNIKFELHLTDMGHITILYFFFLPKTIFCGKVQKLRGEGRSMYFCRYEYFPPWVYNPPKKPILPKLPISMHLEILQTFHLITCYQKSNNAIF